MAQAYTELLWHGPVTETARTVLIVPTGRRWVLRDVEVTSPVGDVWLLLALEYEVLSLHLPASTGGSAHAQWQGRIAVPADQEISSWCYGGQAILTLTGYDFSAL